MKKILVSFISIVCALTINAQTSFLSVSEMLNFYNGKVYKPVVSTLQKKGFQYGGYDNIRGGGAKYTWTKNCTVESGALSITRMGTNNSGVIVTCDVDNYNGVMSTIREEVYNQANLNIIKKQITALGYKKGFTGNNGQFYVKNEKSPVILVVSGDRFGYKYNMLTIWSYAGYIDNYGEKKPANANAVDLGLSVLWSDRNIGATAVEDYGVLATCPFTYWNAGQAEYSGNKDDRARKDWGDNWRIPSRAEFEELCNRCRKEPVKFSNGVIGVKFIGPNGNSIVLPLSGLERPNANIKKNPGVTGCYWTSTFYNDMFVMTIAPDGRTLLESSDKTSNLLSIRPVKNKGENPKSAADKSAANKSAANKSVANKSVANKSVANKSVANGVYVYDKQGNFTAVDKWDTKNNRNVVGIALITKNTRALIALHNAGDNTKYVWGPDGVVDGVPRSTSNSNSDAGNILSDYDGKGNTEKIVNALYPSTNTALYQASHYIFPNGESGYLPALGEIIDAFRNLDAINAALLKTGGDVMKNDWYWTSSMHIKNYRAWSIDGNSLNCFAQLRNERSPLASQYGAAYILVRPFGSL